MKIASPPQTAKRSRSRRRTWRLRVDQRRLAALVPAQGEWTVDDYLWLTQSTSRFIELSEGWIEVLPPPTETHQQVSANLCRLLDEALQPRGSIVLFGALRLRLADTCFREPDLLVLLDPRDPRQNNEYWLGADLVVEIPMPSNADHDLVTKRAEYAAAGIPEYWIVDFQEACVTVLTLEGAAYREHGRFARGDSVTSPLVPGFTVAVDKVFAMR